LSQKNQSAIEALATHEFAALGAPDNNLTTSLGREGLPVARRALGEGSISRRPDGRWAAALQLDGKRKWVYGRTQTEVKERLHVLRKQASTRGTVVVERHTIGELLELWHQRCDASLRPSTRRVYRCYAKVVGEALGEDTLLTRVTPARLQRLVNAQASPVVADKVFHVLRGLFKLAISLDWVLVDPMATVLKPRRDRKPREWWSPDQIRHFIESTRHSSWWPVWTFALATGARLGEISALRWSDIDLERRVVRIERTGQEIEGTWIEGAPKTPSARRVIPLNHLALEALARQRELQAAWREAAGSAWHASDLVFTTRGKGRPFCHSHVNSVFVRAVKQVRLPHLTVHGLRHLAASLALQAGAPLPVVSRHLGHSNVAVTASIYSHALTTTEVVSEAIGAALVVRQP